MPSLIRLWTRVRASERLSTPGLRPAAVLLATLIATTTQAQIPVTAPVSSPTSAMGPIPTPPQPDAIPLRSAGPASSTPEAWTSRGRFGRTVSNVSQPTLTPFLPDPSKATGAAVVIAPGGGFIMLSMDAEGYDVARWLADRGVAAFVLKYRTDTVPGDSRAAAAFMAARMKTAIEGRPIQTPPEALADAEAAMRLVRSRAAQWRVDPSRLGFVGFSAGAILALSIGLQDDPAARPAFIAPIYPPMNARPVPKDAPPMFVAIALDDPLFARGKPLGLIDSWRDAGRPVEAHLFGRGGHGFGFQGHSAATALWSQEFYAWMQDQNLLHANP